MVVPNFGDQPRCKRLPFAAALGAPATRTARRVAGEARRLDQPFQVAGDGRAIRRAEARAEAYVVEQAFVVVEPEQQRSHELSLACIAEAPDDTIGGPQQLVFLHAGPKTRLIGQIATLGDGAVDAGPERSKPARIGAVVRDRGQAQELAATLRNRRDELLERGPPPAKRLLDAGPSTPIDQQVEHDE